MPSTQDAARSAYEELPVLVMAPTQTAARGRSGARWETAPRALAVSLAVAIGDDRRPLSLMAGVAAKRALGGIRLKWPNDLLIGDSKVGGILVEISDDVAVVGLGLNLWWPTPPEGFGALFADDPGPDRYAEVGALWGAEMLRLLVVEGWPMDEYKAACSTLGRLITWEPSGKGRALDVDEDGALLVEAEGETGLIRSGAVRHIRPAGD